MKEAGNSQKNFAEYLNKLGELYIDGYTVISIGLSSTFDSILSHLQSLAMTGIEPQAWDKSNILAQKDSKKYSGSSQNSAMFLLVYIFLSILACSASTTFCMRAAFDQDIVNYTANVRKQNQRNENMQDWLDE